MRPTTCGRCGASLLTVAGRAERWDPSPGVWVGFLDCAACGAMYVYQRPGPAPRSLELKVSRRA